VELVLGCTTRPYGTLPFAEACQHIAAAGYTDVALFRNVGIGAGNSREEILTARQTADDAGLIPSMLLGATHLDLGLEAAVSDYFRLIDSAALLGATWLLDTGLSQETLFDDYYALMQKAAAHAADVGVRITLKPHGGITLTTADLVTAYQRINHPAFGICYDPGNIIYYTQGHERPEATVAQVAPLVTTGIIKDCALNDDVPDVMITPGEGLVDFEAVLSTLAQAGFSGPLYLECVGGQSLAEIDENVRRTRAFIQGILSGLAG
jgi:sugar phosphate isomerase/epimerase